MYVEILNTLEKETKVEIPSLSVFLKMFITTAWMYHFEITSSVLKLSNHTSCIVKINVVTIKIQV